MDIYFAASIRGGRKYLLNYKKIVTHLIENGHSVLTEHVVLDDVIEQESKFTPSEIFNRDIEWLNKSACMIADVSNPSLGVGYEICYALQNKIPTLCVFQSGSSVSQMISGNSSSYLKLFEFNDFENLFVEIDHFINNLVR
jgi:nucleoside 2-deoxyribosyltransferase